jgi:xylose isomerase
MDLFYAHIGGMDAFACGLIIANQIIQDNALSKYIDERYSSFHSGIGAQIMSGKAGLEDAEKWVLQQGAPALKSGRLEMLENILNSYLHS